jgi:hypothetical protein
MTVNILVQLLKPLPAPLPNPLLRGEGKGIIFNTGEALNLFFVSSGTELITQCHCVSAAWR